MLDMKADSRRWKLSVGIALIPDYKPSTIPIKSIDSGITLSRMRTT
jgi:hypothetical protein